MKNGLFLKGEVNLKIYEQGQLIEDSIIQNVITYVGLDALLGNLFYVPGVSTRASSVIKNIVFGTGSAGSGDPSVSTFTNPYIKEYDSVVYGQEQMPNGKVARYLTCAFSLSESEGNGQTYREMGLWSLGGYIDNDLSTWALNPVADRGFNRIVRAPIVKTSAITLQGEWRINAYVFDPEA